MERLFVVVAVAVVVVVAVVDVYAVRSITGTQSQIHPAHLLHHILLHINLV